MTEKRCNDPVCMVDHGPIKTIGPFDFKVGDRVERFVGGSYGTVMSLLITALTEEEPDEYGLTSFVRCGPWKFRKHNGAEVDSGLGWNGVTITGSYILPVSENEEQMS